MANQQHNDKLSGYNQQLLERALSELKTKREWQDAEADDMRPNTYGPRRHMNAYELLDRYNAKIQKSYQAEEWHLAQIQVCDREIANLQVWNTNSKSKAHKIKHWTQRRIDFDLAYQKQVKKSNRYEKLIMKWVAICFAIQQAEITKEITAEKHGNGNKYGFNPNMQDRGTATGIFTDD